MKCKICNMDLVIMDSTFVSPVDTDVVSSVSTLGCINPKCEVYAGKDLTNPKHIAETVTKEV